MVTSPDRVQCYFIVPNKISLRDQTIDRLSKFIKKLAQDNKKLERVQPESMVIKLATKKQGDEMVGLMKKIRESKPSTTFIFLQDECHWGAGNTSAASYFTKRVLSEKNSFVVGISATPNNQLILLCEHHKELNALIEKIVVLESEDYIGREKFIASKHYIETEIPEKSTTIAKSYLCEIGFSKPSSSQKIVFTETEHSPQNFKETTREVISQLFDEGLVVLSLSSQSDAKTFAETFAYFLNKNFPNNDILVCYSISDNDEYVTSANCCCENITFSNLLGTHRACLLVVVGRATMGDTFPKNFKYFDLRDKFRTSAITWTPFIQMCGRAFGYGERPKIILHKDAMKVFMDEKEATKSDLYLGSNKNYKNQSSNVNLPQNSNSHENYADYVVDIDNELTNFGKGLELEDVQKKNPEIIIVSKESDPDIPLDDNKRILFFENGAIYSVVNKKSEYHETWMSLDQAMEIDISYYKNLQQLNLVKITKNHAGINDTFSKTFKRRLYLVAEPQMGKTGVMLELFYKVVEKYPTILSTPGYPDLYKIHELSKQKQNKGVQIFQFGKYGKITLLHEPEKIPDCYKINGPIHSRTTILRRVDKMIHVPNENLPNRTETNVQLDKNQFFEMVFDDCSIFCSKNLKNINWEKKKFPLMFVSTGRSNLDININWTANSNDRKQIIVTTISDYANYYSKYGKTHEFIILKANEPSVGLQRKCSVEFADKMNISYFWLLDDNLDKRVKFRDISSVQDVWNGEPSLLDVVHYIEDESWEERCLYALCSPGKKNKYETNSQPFSCESGKGMTLINVKRVAPFNYLPIRVAEDLELAFHLAMNNELVCRFECFAVRKKNLQGGCKSDTAKCANVEELYRENECVGLLDQILPKCLDTSLIVPNVGVPKELFDKLKGGRNLVAIEDVQETTNLCGTYIERENLFDAFLLLVKIKHFETCFAELKNFIVKKINCITNTIVRENLLKAIDDDDNIAKFLTSVSSRQILLEYYFNAIF